MRFPNTWFFFDPFDKSSKINFSRANKSIGIIFYSNSKLKNKFSAKIKDYIDLCKQNRIFFLIQNSVDLAIRHKAIGVFCYLDYFKKSSNLKLLFLKRPSHIKIFTSVHNLKEIKFSEKKNFDVIFISPLYKTQSHPNYRPLGPVNFINLCTKSSLINLALGGVTKKNYRRIKNNNIAGFGGITYFKNNSEYL